MAFPSRTPDRALKWAFICLCRAREAEWLSCEVTQGPSSTEGASRSPLIGPGKRPDASLQGKVSKGHGPPDGPLSAPCPASHTNCPPGQPCARQGGTSPPFLHDGRVSGKK